METTLDRMNSNIRLSHGSRVVTQASGAHLPPITHRVLRRTGIMGRIIRDRNVICRTLFMITIKTAIRMCILIATTEINRDFNNSVVVWRRSWLTIPQLTMMAMYIPSASTNLLHILLLICSTCRRYHSSIPHRRIIHPKTTKTPLVFRVVRPTTHLIC